MEPTTREVIVYHTKVTDIKPHSKDQWGFSMDHMHTLWQMTGPINLAIGDRVRITITKEPSPDALPR